MLLVMSDTSGQKSAWVTEGDRERERGKSERERGGAHWFHCAVSVWSVFFTGLLTPHCCSWPQLSALRMSLISDDTFVTFV